MSQFSYNQPIGEILTQANLISSAQIDVALRDQKRYQDLQLGDLKIGEILALRGWIKQETTDFFVRKWATLLNQKPKKPIGYYLCEAGLLSDRQIRYLLQEQQKLSVKLKLGELAYLEGWLNPKTVEYFVTSLSNKNTLTANTFSLSKEHQIIKQYTKGKTDFQNLQLNKIYLKNATLKGTNLDNSNFEQAIIQGINLSYCSLKSVNFSQANMPQASFKEADLRKANFERANLNKAFLEAANLKQANLKQANLKQASLIKASLEGADLRGANLQGALFYGACYDRTTYFDSDFDPLKEGMKFTETSFKSSNILLM